MPHIDTLSTPSIPARLRDPDYVDLVFALVFIWGFGDAVSTVVAAEFAGVELEVNPWIRALLIHEPMLVILLKMAVALYVGVILLECRSVVERVPLSELWLGAIIGLGTGVVFVNFTVAAMALPL